MPPDVRIHQVAFYKGRLKKMSKSPKISQKTVDNPEHNAYNSGVKRNRNSSGQGAERKCWNAVF